MNFRILGKRWKIKKLGKKKYKKKYGRGSCAITIVYKRMIVLGPKGYDRETIVHELVHAYLSELCLHSADFDEDNLEEVFCELLAKFGNKLLSQAHDLHKRLNSAKYSNA